jgi:acyl-coenzyme A thioesterase PaaI-like protein
MTEGARLPESFRTRLARRGFNLFPAYWASGARIRYIAADWREVRIDLRLGVRTRNYFGTIFGGSMFAATDPVYALMLVKNLGPGYEVWDKAGSIRFRRPGRGTLYATFRIDDAELDEIRTTHEREPKLERNFRTTLRDEAGEVHAEVERLVHLRRKR